MKRLAERSRAAVTVTLLATLALFAPAVVHAQAVPPGPVNVMPDSPAGWKPSPELQRLAVKVVVDFVAAKDGGRAAEAYALLTEKNQRNQSLATFSAKTAEYNQLAGPVKSRRITGVSWKKDAPPALGVYAAVDLVSSFAEVDRHCGYVVLYQAAPDAAFQVMRQEDNYLTNAMAKSIEQQHSKAKLEEAWSGLSAKCPNYQRQNPTASAAGAGKVPLPEVANTEIGYATVAAALAGLRARPGMDISVQQGWTVMNEKATNTFWSFAPADHPAYPAAVKRKIVEVNGALTMQMQVLCEATKAACDDLVRSFQKLTAEMSKSLKPAGTP